MHALLLCPPPFAVEETKTWLSSGEALFTQIDMVASSERELQTALSGLSEAEQRHADVNEACGPCATILTHVSAGLERVRAMPALCFFAVFEVPRLGVRVRRTQRLCPLCAREEWMSSLRSATCTSSLPPVL
jgi:hypothetical protein